MSTKDLNAVYLDLDDVDPIADFTVKLNGKEHKVVETSVSDFIQTARDLKSLGVQADLESELDVSLKIIKRALPSVPDEELRALKLTQLHKIRDFVLTVNGEKAEEAAPAAGEGTSGNAVAAK